jgi:hypothetical protein
MRMTVQEARVELMSKFLVRIVVRDCLQMP